MCASVAAVHRQAWCWPAPRPWVVSGSRGWLAIASTSSTALAKRKALVALPPLASGVTKSVTVSPQTLHTLCNPMQHSLLANLLKNLQNAAPSGRVRRLEILPTLGLENRRPARDRGFESHPLRQPSPAFATLSRASAFADRSRLRPTKVGWQATP